jgi:hypothetical protein
MGQEVDVEGGWLDASKASGLSNGWKSEGGSCFTAMKVSREWVETGCW